MTTLDEDIRIHRALAGTASDEDWATLDALASRDSAVWERLARSLRDDRELAAAVEAASSKTEPFEVPVSTPRTTSRVSGRAGWLVAAAIAIAAGFSHLSRETAGDTAKAADPVASETVTELPNLYLESRRGPSGIEVLFVKRTVERAVVGEMLEVRNDDSGRSIAVPATISVNSLPSTL